MAMSLVSVPQIVFLVIEVGKFCWSLGSRDDNVREIVCSKYSVEFISVSSGIL